jgi:hypothetical protein
MVLNNSVREILLKQQEINNYENNLISILPDLDMFGIEEICKKNMIRISKIIELKKGRKRKKDIIVEKEDIQDSDILPDELSDSESDYEQINSEPSIINDISYVESPINDDKLTIISRDIDLDDDLNNDVDDDLNNDVDDDLNNDVDGDLNNDLDDDLNDDFNDDKDKNNDTLSGGDKMNNLLFGCLERIHKKGGNTINKPNLTQHIKTLPSPKENYGGSIGPIKKIKLTEKYDFF